MLIKLIFLAFELANGATRETADASGSHEQLHVVYCMTSKFMCGFRRHRPSLPGPGLPFPASDEAVLKHDCILLDSDADKHDLNLALLKLLLRLFQSIGRSAQPVCICYLSG